MRIAFVATLLSCLPMMAAAQSYTAFNKLKVVPLGQSRFEVIEARGEGARGMWCAAASFALDRLGAARNTRMYVHTPRGRSVSGAGRIGVTFTLNVNQLSAQPTRAYSVSVRQAGQGLPLHHAYQFCKDYQIEPEDI